MAKTGAIQKNKRRQKITERQREKRSELKAIIRDQSRPSEERFEAVLRLAKLPRNGSAVRVRNRCALTGRPRGYYRKLGLSRIALRELASAGQIPGMVKSSW
jgi:small subunit ribosomal protein S14